MGCFTVNSESRLAEASMRQFRAYFQELRTMTQKTGHAGTEDRWSSRGSRTGRASKEVKMPITAGRFSHHTLWIQEVFWSSRRRLWKGQWGCSGEINLIRLLWRRCALQRLNKAVRPMSIRLLKELILNVFKMYFAVLSSHFVDIVI